MDELEYRQGGKGYFQRQREIKAEFKEVKTMDKKPENNKISDQELDQIRAGSAIYVNGFYLTFMGSDVRLTFTEEIEGKRVPRDAVVMPLVCAVQIKSAIEQITELVKKQASQKDTLTDPQIEPKDASA